MSLVTFHIKICYNTTSDTTAVLVCQLLPSVGISMHCLLLFVSYICYWNFHETAISIYFEEGCWNKQFILSQSYSTFLTVQIITITFIESELFEHGDTADTEFLTLWFWMVYIWTTQNSTLVHICGTQTSRNKCSLHVPWCTTLCFHFLLLLMVEKFMRGLQWWSWWYVHRGNPEWCPHVSVDCSEMHCIASDRLGKIKWDRARRKNHS